MTTSRERIEGSNREPVAGATCVGPCDPAQTIHVTVTLRRQSESMLDERVQKIARGEQVEPLAREAFTRQFGAQPDDIAKVEAFAGEYGLRVAGTDPAASTVTLEGTIAQFQKAFDVELSHYEHPRLGHFRGRTGHLTIPSELRGVVTAVLGLDDRPQARPHFRMRPVIEPRRAAETFTPLQIAELYGFPAGDGRGQCIALIELGGGYEPDELRRYFGGLGVTPPEVVAVGVGGAANAPTGDPSGPDGEVTLDIEIAGAVAPGARIAVYFAPNSDAGFIAAIKQAIHDTTNKPSIVSISWGAPESSWTAQATNALNQALKDAAALGVTVCAAAGDSGSSDETAGADAVDFPASSPYSLACGGTRLTARSVGATSLSITNEVVWNDGSSGGATGGGVSGRFPLPAWQRNLEVARTDGPAQALTARGVPDVAGDASPGTGYEVLVGGQLTSVGGTSAVAPLYAGLIARINAAMGKPAGLVHPVIYRTGSAFRDITEGNNGSFAAAPGWDACTGLGSPRGSAWAAALGAKDTKGASGA